MSFLLPSSRGLYHHYFPRTTHAQTMAATDQDEGRKPLGKNPPRTGGVPAAETTDLQMQEKRCPGQRQVSARAPVSPMHGSRTVLTARTHGRAPPAAEGHMPFIQRWARRRKRARCGNSLCSDAISLLNLFNSRHEPPFRVFPSHYSITHLHLPSSRMAQTPGILASFA